MGDIRYFILSHTNFKRGECKRHPLFIHERNSDAAQKHAQYVLEEMQKWGEHRIWEIKHSNPFFSGEYASENMGYSKGSDSLEGHISGIISSFDESHWNNMINPAWAHIGAEIAYNPESGLLVLVQRFY
ncbi:MAG: CAP domain-containing protein [archaeon]